MLRHERGRDRVFRTALALLSLGSFASSAQGQPAQAETRSKLNISVLVGEGAVHNVRQPKPTEVVIEVKDENGRPVAGAIVVFQLPAVGASGLFPGESLFATVAADEAGRAAVKGLQPNASPGKWNINVTASYQGLTVSLGITQVLSLIHI